MKVPLIDAEPPPEFGAVVMDPSFADPNGANFSSTYVPGFSDMRIRRDTEIAEVRAGTRQAKDVSTLPVNCRWVRCQRVSGEPDNTKLWTASQQGYQPVKASQVGQEAWLKDMPLGSTTDGNGMIRNGDTVLCVASAQRAGQNFAMKAARTRERLEGAKQSFAVALGKERANTKGADPYVESTVAKRKEK